MFGPSYSCISKTGIIYFTDCGANSLAVGLSQSDSKLIVLPAITAPCQPPKSMKLINTIYLPSFVHSVAKHNNILYVGLENRKVMCSDRNVNTPALTEFADVGGFVSSIEVYNNELYVLSANAKKVVVYSLDKILKRSWSHNGHSGNFNKLRVINDQVFVPGRSQKSLAVYDLQGTLIKQITCPTMSNNQKALAVCGDDSFILSDYGANSVSRININSGEVMWTSKHVQRPLGVVCYKSRYVLVTNQNSNTRIWILDINTGKFLCEFLLSNP